MQLDQLQLDLRPRTNAQALDLGFALLRANAIQIYVVWLCLWIPLVCLCGVLAFTVPPIGFWRDGMWLLFAWLCRPWLERAPLYMLSRQVFGEQVSWQETLRAWPSQLGGGFTRLFWLRPFAAGRGLYQAIWQLEGARKKNARYRIRVIGKHTSGSATWFGIACAHFEGIIQLGFYACISLFLSDAEFINPLALFTNADPDQNVALMICGMIAFALSGAIIGPIYTACCFTLYLNRRATLEAWDIEIALRQLKPVVKEKTKLGGVVSLMFFVLALGGVASQQEAYAQKGPQVPSIVDGPICQREKLIFEKETPRQITDDAQLKQTRQEVDRIYRNPDFQFYECKETWVPIEDKSKKDSKIDPQTEATIKQIALVLKYVFISLAIAFVLWLISRYRGQFFGFIRPEQANFATEVAGLDIRPESLPDDVTATALELWARGERRAAIALLYRASLARLVEQYQLKINRGATENDCLALAKQALREAHFASNLYVTLEMCTNVWLKAAYANQYPGSISQLCQQWKAVFDLERTGGQA